ncbi:hypothetical protein TNCV_5089651 [Trichonephila clavipes]|nr:hypothetical protein TNCV_5089651 [Trichonephila clavipes]
MTFLLGKEIYGTLIAKTTDSCHELEPSTAENPPCMGAMHVKCVQEETSSRWCGVVVRRGGCQLRCCPRHLTMVQNDEVRRQKPSSS